MKLPKLSCSVVHRPTRFNNYSGEVNATANRRGVEPSSGGGGGGSTPPVGCWPSGTECRGWRQKMVYCCPGGTTWKRDEGWCVGWWDAPPCY